MTRIKALEVIKNMENTILAMKDDAPVSNEQFPPARMKKTKLVAMQTKLIKKYKIDSEEYSK
jgi:hypothetical protein|tara:strand:- start:1860 stop:2045 length:186 start_codon:yes stop_codon:yes gene_type:complete